MIINRSIDRNTLHYIYYIVLFRHWLRYY